MSYYYASNDLLDAINYEAGWNANFAYQLDKAIRSKNKGWLRRSVEYVASTMLGGIVYEVIKGVLRFFGI